MEREIKTEDLTELIDFTTLLQLFNMEKKSLKLISNMGGGDAHIVFDNGEIIDAGFNELRGVEAFKKIILEKPKKFKIVKTKKKIPKTIEIPFMNLLLESVKNVDDVNRQDNSKQAKKKKGRGKKKILIEDVFNEQFMSALDSIKGFSGCFVANEKGILVWKHYQFLSDIKFSFTLAHNFVQEIGGKFFEKFSWRINYIDVYLEKKILFLKGLEIDGNFYTLILILDSTGNEAMAKRVLGMLERSLAG